MNPFEEALDLKENPLPVLKTEGDDLLPSNIFMIDEEIRQLQDSIKSLQDERDAMVERAIALDIYEDSFCRLEKKVRAVRTLNVEKFRAAFPKAFDQICEMQRHQIERELAEVGTSIPVGVADKFVPKKETVDCVEKKEFISWSTVRKER